MGLQFNKKLNITKNSWVNISKSGVSYSIRVGPFTLNSNGRKTVNLGNGIKYVKYKKGGKK